MTKEDLNSDRVNYLVWRYLQESNYRETALKLQKEWNVEDPQVFDFAPHVQSRALVAVLQRGLLYHEAERQIAQTRLDIAAPLPGFFGPLTPLSPPRGAGEDDYENVRKRELDQRPSQLQNGSAPKRQKLSNGHENGIELMAMDVDETPNGNSHAYPSPKEVEQPPTLPVTSGPDQATQVDKVHELGSQTTFLTLTDSDHPNCKPVVLHCAWNPQNPAILAAAGTDKLARVWTISRGAATEIDGHVNSSKPPYRDLLDSSAPAKHPDNTTITALSWTSDGCAIALASVKDSGLDVDEAYEGGSATVSIWSSDGAMIQECLGFEGPITCLRWNPSDTNLLTFVPEDDSTLIAVLSPSTQRTAVHNLLNHNLAEQPLDAIWITEQEFVVCGGEMLSTFIFSKNVGTINQIRKYETREDHQLFNVAYDRHCKLLATSSETGFIDIWDQSGLRHSRQEHEGLITSLQWQPVPNHIDLDSNVERFVISAGVDGVICIWSTRRETRKRRTTMPSTVVALACTSDGVFIAGATNQKILIWRFEDLNVPRAHWERASETEWRKPKTDAAIEEEEDTHCLAWDAHGQKLAYGVQNQLAVIEWRRIINGVEH